MRRAIRSLLVIVRSMLGSRFGRPQYRRVWNEMSATEDAAKMAVGGFTDEAAYRATGEATRDLLQHCVGIGASDVVLEIGAGVGRVGAVLAPLCREWIGGDVSDNMVRHIGARLRHFPNVRTVLLSGYDLAPIPSGSVDVVYCTVVFMHLDEWDRFGYVQEGMRVLRPGGRMLVDNVNLLSDAGWAFFERHRAIPPDLRPSHISRTSTPQELETYFRRAGFRDVRQRENGEFVAVYGVK
jgi:SAM-dependent methyltransferase